MPCCHDPSARMLQSVAESDGLTTTPGYCDVHGECDMMSLSYFHSIGLWPVVDTAFVEQFRIASWPRSTTTFWGVFVRAPSAPVQHSNSKPNSNPNRNPKPNQNFIRIAGLRNGGPSESRADTSAKLHYMNMFNQSISQSVSQSVSQSINQSVNQSVSQSVSQSINQSINLFGDSEKLRIIKCNSISLSTRTPRYGYTNRCPDSSQRTGTI